MVPSGPSTSPFLKVNAVAGAAANIKAQDATARAETIRFTLPSFIHAEGIYYFQLN